MRKALVVEATGAVENIVTIAVPRSWRASLARRIIQQALPEKKWLDLDTGETITRAAVPEIARWVLHSPAHGLRNRVGPIVAFDLLPPELIEGVRYWARVLDADDFLLTTDIVTEPFSLNVADAPGSDFAIDLAEVPFEISPGPPPGYQFIDDDGTAQIGGTWDGAQFVAKPPPDPAVIDAIKALEAEQLLDRAVDAIFLNGHWITMKAMAGAEIVTGVAAIDAAIAADDRAAFNQFFKDQVKARL